MNIEEAIEVLEQDHTSQETGEQSDYQDAIQLGIDALKWIKEGRVTYTMFPNKPLPGETE